MTNVLIINGHQPYPTSPGTLNASFVALADKVLAEQGCDIQQVKVCDDWNVQDEVERQLWAELILLQFPLNSMSIPWSLKRYLDEVYTAGMDGRLARGDGRTRSDPCKQYGSGGLMQGRSYMLSVTLNAPENAFGDSAQNLFTGRTLDDLLSPLHINFAFFGLETLKTFAAYDVSKAPTIERDLERFHIHLKDVLELKSGR